MDEAENILIFLFISYLQGPTESNDEQWMRNTISFSVGYFVNDLLLILMYPQVGADMP